MSEFDKIIQNYKQINQLRSELADLDQSNRDCLTRHIQSLIYKIPQIKTCKVHFSDNGYFYEINGEETRINFAFSNSVENSIREEDGVKALLLKNNIKESDLINFSKEYETVRSSIIKETQRIFEMYSTFLYNKDCPNVIQYVSEPRSQGRFGRLFGVEDDE